MSASRKGFSRRTIQTASPSRGATATPLSVSSGRSAYREGIGDLLARGPIEAARLLGGGSDYFAINVKGTALHRAFPRAEGLGARSGHVTRCGQAPARLAPRERPLRAEGIGLRAPDLRGQGALRHLAGPHQGDRGPRRHLHLRRHVVWGPRARSLGLRGPPRQCPGARISTRKS